MGSTRNAVPGYDIPDLHVTRHRLLDMPIRTSSLCSLGAHLNAFAIESFMDELAAADAVGVRVRDLPLTSAQIARAIEASWCHVRSRISRRADRGSGAPGR